MLAADLLHFMKDRLGNNRFMRVGGHDSIIRL